MRKLFSLLGLMFVVNVGSAQTTLYWDGSSATTTASGSHTNISNYGTWTQLNGFGTATMISTTSPSSGYTGFSGTSNFGIPANIGALNTSTSPAFTFTITTSSPGIIKITDFSFGSRSTGTGPVSYSLRSSIDNYANDIATGSLAANSTWLLKTNSGISANNVATQQSVTFRLYGYGGTGSPSSNSINWRIDDIKITLDNTALPVSFSSINATKIGKNNKVTWSTASEEHNRGFDVQRSTDGVNYTSLGFVNSLSSTGNSSSTLNYSFIDYDPIGLKQYYRLKQTDFDGTSRYSGVVVVTNAVPERLAVTSIYPNPASSFVHLSLASPSREAMQLIVTDVNGRSVRNKYVNAGVGNNSFEVEVAGLGAGIYYLSLKGPLTGWQSVGKFVKN